MSLNVIGSGVSPYVRKVCVFLAEKNLSYEHDPMIPMNVSDEYKKKSPLGKIPCLEHDGRPIPDSSVICDYLERVFPDPPLYPEDPYDRARALFLEEYADTKMVDAGIAVFQERVLAKRFFQREPEQAKVDQAINEGMPPFLDYLEEQIGENEYLVAGRFTLADIAVASPYVNFLYADYRPDASRWPKLAAYLDRIHSRPSFKALIEEGRAALGL